ncbi:MAG: outer membrane beta-barrel protein [Calditrichia bacterium]
MKYCKIALYSFLLFTTLAFGHDPKGSFFLSLQGGLNLSRFDASGAVMVESQPYELIIYKPAFAANLEYRFATGITLKSGLVYSQGGGKWEEEFNVTDLNGNVIKFNFIQETHFFEVPLRVQYRIPTGPTSLYVQTGGSIALLSSARLDSDIISQTGRIQPPRIFELQDAFNDVNFSLDFGGGFSVPLSDNFEAGLELLYEIGLINLTKEVGITQKSRDIKILLGITTRL